MSNSVRKMVHPGFCLRSPVKMTVWFLVTLLVVCGGVLAGMSPLREPGRPRTLQMIGAANPRMLHRISADLQPDTSKVVHIQVPYYIDRPKVRAKKFKPWVPRGHRFVTAGSIGGDGGQLSLKQLPASALSFGSSFRRDIPLKGFPSGAEFLQSGASAVSGPGPYDTPFVPVMKPSPVNPLLPPERPTPEIMFEPISILPLEAPSFATLRNHVNLLKQKQQAFFEGQGREFGFAGATVPDELDYFAAVHNGDVDGHVVQDGERNTLSEDDFGQNDRKYDRRGKALGGGSGEQSGEADFYDSEGKQYQDDDFEDSREEADRVAAFEPQKVYTQVRHQETVRHVPRQDRRNEADEEEEEEDDEDEGGRDTEDEDDDDDEEEAQDEGKDDDEHDEDEEEDDGRRVSARSKGSALRHRRPIKERVKEHKKSIVYSEKGREAQQFDHGSEERFGEFEQNEASKSPKRSRKSKRNHRIKRSEPEEELIPADRTAELTRSDVVDVLAWMILGNGTNITSLPQPEALTDPRELQGEELLRFLDEAIQNTTQYLPETGGGEGAEVISIVSPPSNVVKFPYYHRPATEIDVDSALRYAENLTTFSGGPYGGKAGQIECNEVDVELEDEPEPIADGESEDGFRPIKRLKGLGDRIDCLKAKHFGREPLDNPLFREEFVGTVVRPRKTGSSGLAAAHPAQPNPAVAVYNDVIRHIKKHLASQQRNKNSKSDTDQDTVMIAVPRMLRVDTDGDSSDGRFTIDTGRKREPRLAFPQANPLPVSNHISVPIFDISKFVPRFMMRANDDLFADDLEDSKLIHIAPRALSPPPPPPPPPRPVPSVEPVKPRLSTPKVRLQTLVKTAEQLAEGAVSVEEGVERQLTTAQPIRDDIADAFDDVITKRPDPPAPLPPIRQYSVVEQDSKDGGPEPTFNKSGPPYAALALEPPVAQSILKQRIAPVERNQLDFLKGKKRSPKIPVRKARRPSAVTRKKVLVFYH